MSLPPPSPDSPLGPGGQQPFRPASWGREGLPQQTPPAGYQPYPGAPEQRGTSGMAISALVLSLVGVIPCFWVLQVPGLLGVIFGFIGLGQTKDGRRGRGMSIAGIVVGALLVLLCVAFWIAIAADADHCIEFGSSNMCRD